MITAKIICDSLNSSNCRLTTFVLEYPRFIHAELLTHRVFSKNSASSRAIPFEKFVERITNEPATPVFWGKNRPGMQAIEEIDDSTKDSIYYYREYLGGAAEEIKSELISKREHAKRTWNEAKLKAIESARKLHELGVHKEICNRILEPWFKIKVLLSGTEFDNFFELRCHKDAQREIQAVAVAMRDAMNKSRPQQLDDGEWHIPFGDGLDYSRMQLFINEEIKDLNEKCVGVTSHQIEKYALNIVKCKIAVARCARVSYLNFHGKDDYSSDLTLFSNLVGSRPRHLSPLEHVAQAMDNNRFDANFRGFRQLRKIYEQ